MKVKWIGHACFLITSEKGLQILTDPYEEGFQGILTYGPVQEAPDIVTISHQHGDHNYTGSLLSKPDIVQSLGNQWVKGIEFVGFPSYHDRVSGKQRGDNIIFCFAIDGIQICHCGDLGHPIDNDTLHSLGHIDVLLIPIGGPVATLELDEAIALWEKIRPSAVIPMHYKNNKCSFPKYGVEDLVNLKPEAICVGKSEVDFTKERLPTEQIFILEPST